MGTQPPQQPQMKDMALIRNVFRETLRLFPPVGVGLKRISWIDPS